MVARPESSKGVGWPHPTPFEDSGRATKASGSPEKLHLLPQFLVDSQASCCWTPAGSPGR
jgi:hypothetical protein